MTEAVERVTIYRTMHEISGDERPRERLLVHGPEVLSDAELIALILRSGSRGENVLDMARRLLDSLGGIAALARADLKALQNIRGLGPAKASEIAAAVELGRRVQQSSPEARPLLNSPEAVFALLGPRLIGKTKEHLFAIPLDTRGRLIGSTTPVLKGTVNAVSVRPAEIFREAVTVDAASIVLAHNHPSGDPRPSLQDVAVTKLLIAAGELLDILVLDHVVIGENRFVSFQAEGYAFDKAKRSAG
ncbi:MAG TPA: DNA repair protein RadC [Tepidiformaceae bacterium]|jgi:DNA repair protein RadC|nr:DNA repair protein RadC [Tepidiformaceae bacterium]